MKLAEKFTLALVLVIGVALALGAYLDTERAVRHDVEGIRKAQRDLGDVLSSAVVAIWQREGWEAALRFLDGVEKKQGSTRIRWVWFEDQTRPEYRPMIPVDELIPRIDGDRDIDVDDGRLGDRVISYKPVVLPGLPLGALEFIRSTSREREYVESETHIQILTSAIIVLVYALLAAVLVRGLIGRPIRLLVAQARRVAEGDFSVPSPVASTDEIGMLADEMNLMSEKLQLARSRAETERAARLEVQRQLRHANRLATVGRLAATTIHDLGTPLNVITGRATMIADGGAEQEEIADHARRIGEQAGRMTDMVRQLLDYARRGRVEREVITVNDVVRDVTTLLAPIARGAQVEIAAEVEPLVLWANRGEMRQVLMNLMTNAIHAMPEGGHLFVRAAGSELNSERVLIEVRDEGVGMGPDELGRIFEPFYTTKGEGEGTGLGLNVCKGIVEDHGGRIEVESAPGQGSAFKVYLPRGEART